MYFLILSIKKYLFILLSIKIFHQFCGLESLAIFLRKLVSFLVLSNLQYIKTIFSIFLVAKWRKLAKKKKKKKKLDQ
jgi:hypothetical protein